VWEPADILDEHTVPGTAFAIPGLCVNWASPLLYSQRPESDNRGNYWISAKPQEGLEDRTTWPAGKAAKGEKKASTASEGSH
jgi:hypothetical protein